MRTATKTRFTSTTHLRTSDGRSSDARGGAQASSRRDGPDVPRCPEAPERVLDLPIERAVAVADHVVGSCVPRERFAELLDAPFGVRLIGHREVVDVSTRTEDADERSEEYAEKAEHV